MYENFHQTGYEWTTMFFAQAGQNEEEIAQQLIDEEVEMLGRTTGFASCDHLIFGLDQDPTFQKSWSGSSWKLFVCPKSVWYR